MAFPTGWNRKCKLTLRAARVSGGTPGNEIAKLWWNGTEADSNIPLEMVDADGSYPAQDGGGDIRVTLDEAGTQLTYIHIRSFETDNNPANARAEIAVDVGTLNTSTDVEVWVWYNTAGSESQPAADALGGYEGVYSICFAACPLDENTGDFNDWSENGADATANGGLPDRVAGEVTRYEQDCDGAGDYGNFASNGLSTGAEDVVVFSIWVTPRAADAYLPLFGSVSDTNDGDFSFYIDTEFDEIGGGVVGNDPDFSDFTQAFTIGDQYHIAIRYRADTEQAEFYVNGDSKGTENFDLAVGLRLQEAVRFARDNFSDYFDGEIDELLIINTTKGDNWIKTYYRLWSDPAYDASSHPDGFIIVGTPESTGGDDEELEHDIYRGARRGILRGVA